MADTIKRKEITINEGTNTTEKKFISSFGNACYSLSNQKETDRTHLQLEQKVLLTSI